MASFNPTNEPRSVDERELEELRLLASPADPATHYTLGRELYSWTGARVHEAKTLSTGDNVRVKVVDLTQLPRPELVISELRTMQAVQSPNLASLREAYIVDTQVWLVTEDLPGGSLVSLIERHQLDENQIAYVAREICQGIKDLHANHIVHCDIKSDNIFFDAQGHLKIADFGYSIPLSAPHTNIVGTPYWMAPEVIKDKQYTANADIWALGIVLIEMIDRAPPYVDEEPIKALSLIVENGVPAVRASYRLSAGVKDFLAQCLVVDVSRRASAEELLQHPFLRQAASPASLVPLLQN